MKVTLSLTDYSEFSVHKPIGKGGFGIVYKAKWKDNGLAIALKQLNIISMDEKTIQRFAKEVRNYIIATII